MDEEKYLRIKDARTRLSSARLREERIADNGCIHPELKLDGIGLPVEMVERFNQEALLWAKKQKEIAEAEWAAL